MSYTKYYYQILGVTPSAEDVVIRAAYKALVQRYHPDKYQGDPAEATRIVQELVEAYSILSDPEKRKTYDIWLRRKERQNENKPEEEYAAEDKSEVHEGGASKDASNAPDTGAIEAYIGERNKDYYLAIFKDFDSKGVGLHRSWNWAAFLGGPAWLLYRKMYGFFFLFSTTLVASFILVNTGRAAVGNLIHLFPLYVFAHYANAFYYRQAKRRVLSARMAKGDIGSQLGRLRREGGVHSWVMWASGYLGALFFVTVLIDSANSPIESNPSQLAVPSPDATADAPPPAPAASVQEGPKVIDSDNYIRALYNDRRFNALEEFVQNHLIQNPNDTLALNYSGLALQALGDKSGARRRFRAAIALNPESPTLYNNLVSTYDPHTEYKTIIEILKAAHEVEPNNKPINDSLAEWQLYAQRKDAEVRAKTEHMSSSSSDMIPDSNSERRNSDESECQVKPVMTDAEIRHWRICSKRIR